MLNNVKNKAMQYGSGHSNWFNLYSNFIGSFYEVAIVGNEVSTKIKELNKTYIPNKLIAGSTNSSNLPLLQNRFFQGETKIFICVDGACQMPTNEVKTALEMIKVSF
jgi:uncharacterized protein YyaL (SSP411 family)